jgi:hypothetical protein
VKHIVALSGGKDSTAMALALAEREPRDYFYVITPTGNELPEMYDHWRKLAELLGKPLTPMVAQGKLFATHTLQSLIREQVALPNHTARWCTRILKLEPYYEWLATQTPCVSYVGLRADEEGRTGMVFPDADGVQMRFPMQEWGWKLQDALDFLAEKAVTVPERTDCAVCFWQKLGEWYLLWLNHPDLYAEGEELEGFVTRGRNKPYTFRSPQRDAWPASLADLRREFEKGRVPQRSLDMMDKRRLVGACRVCTL